MTDPRPLSSAFDLDVTDQPSEDDVARLEKHLEEFNKSQTGIFDDRLLSIILKRAGEVYAGLHGHTWGACCVIKVIWIAEQSRRQGLGTALLVAAELEARQRGCRQIVLSSHDFQAPEFYEKQGFQRLATVCDNPAGHTDILFVKPLL